MSVPAAYVGLWRRTVIRRANGAVDRDTRVLWFQGDDYHIDLRIPAGAFVPEAQIAFAGTTLVEGDRCEWRPEIAFPFVAPEVDAGIMRFDAPDRLHEAGVDGSYDEDWERIDAGPVTQQRSVREDGEVRYVLTSASHMAWARGRPDDRYPGRWTEVGFARREGDGWRVIACNDPIREGEYQATSDA